MPVTDLSGGDDDWLQQFLAGHQAGQAFGASQPYGASGYPDNLPNRPYGPPGSAQVGWPGASPGAPSMGYPAMGQPTAQQPPAATPGPAQGLSLTNNPIMHALSALNPIGSANAATDPRLGSSVTMNASQPLPPTARDALPLAYGNVTSQDYQNWLKAQGVGQSSPAATTTADPSGRAAPWWFTPSNNPMPWRQPSSLAKSDPNAPPGRRSYVGQPPGAGAPTGRPSQTPTPPQGAQSARIGTPFQYVVPNSTASRAPIYTAMNLFGGGQQAQSAPAQPAVNPANVPSPNAQTVSGGGPMPQATVNRLASNYPGRMAMSANQIASYIGTQPWLQNLGGPASQQMTPGALASAVRRPNWWGQFA